VSEEGLEHLRRRTHIQEPLQEELLELIQLVRFLSQIEQWRVLVFQAVQDHSAGELEGGLTHALDHEEQRGAS
jgi:hypothetical protein